jgi:hypothetical protein
VEGVVDNAVPFGQTICPPFGYRQTVKDWIERGFGRTFKTRQ